jgi:hypothetical protein
MRLSLPAPFQRLAHASRDSAPVTEARPRRWSGRTIVKKRGLLAPLLQPIGIAIGIVVVGVPAIAVWNIYSASEARRAEHDAAVNRGNTVVETNVKRQVADGETEFVLRLIDGKLVRVIAAKDATDAFLNQTLIALETARADTHRAAARDLDQLFARTFASREADLQAYADWFFEWGRSWRFLYEAVSGAVQEAARLSFSRTQVSDAARAAVEAYLLRHYQELVLKPELRDASLVSGVRDVLKGAHDKYAGALARLDDSMQRFLSEKARYVEALDASSVTVRIDWDAEKWKAPRTIADDRTLQPVASAALIGGGAVMGSMVGRIVVPFFARTTAEVMASTEMTVGGAAAGSVEPGLGTAIGALAGAALDWGISRFTDYVQRDGFIADNSAALDATITAWKGAMLPPVDKAIDVWFDDTRAIVASQATHG